jgi:hypothetical protein
MKRKSISSIVVVLALVLLVSISSTSTAMPLQQATPPAALTYQGHLLDETGSPVPDGIYETTFSLWDASTGGVCLWGPETHNLEISDGFFAVVLGISDPIDAADLETNSYIEIAVGGETLAPRQQIASVAFALVADEAKYADAAPWAGLTDVPAGFADGVDDDTTYTAGNQLSLTGTRFDVLEGSGSDLDADLLDGQEGSYYRAWGNLTGVPAALADGDDDTTYTAGTGLGLAGTTFSVNFAGSGTASTASRSDHTHDWGDITSGVPAGLADGDDDTTYSAGGGLDLAATTFSVDVTDIRGTGLSETSNNLEVATTYRLPQTCANGQIAEWNGTTWQCGDDDTGGGAHDHWGETWTGTGTGLTLSGGARGLSGSGSNEGVCGYSSSGYGIHGLSSSGYGVYGSGDYGVYGNGGLRGVSGNGGTFGVYGDGSSYGVYGHSDSTGVRGDGGNYGVYGDATYGVFGVGDNAGVYGQSTSAYGVYSDGHFHAEGNITCDGTKSSVAETADYRERTLYAIESPEVWFEDFGADTLVNGVITVTIEPIFAQTVNLTENYHVFVTPLNDEPVLLFITDKGDASFTVRGVTLDGETAECDFDWRLTAKRLGYEDTRLELIPDKLIEAQEMAQEEQHPVPETFLETPETPIAGVTQ